MGWTSLKKCVQNQRIQAAFNHDEDTIPRIHRGATFLLIPSASEELGLAAKEHPAKPGLHILQSVKHILLFWSQHLAENFQSLSLPHFLLLHQFLLIFCHATLNLFPLFRRSS